MPTVLELTNTPCVKLEGVLEDVVIIIASRSYPYDFLILQTKSNLEGHPWILGRPYMVTMDTFIGCRSGSMIILNGQATKKFNLYNQENQTWILTIPGRMNFSSNQIFP